jgi:cytochrome c peroxidase
MKRKLTLLFFITLAFAVIIISCKKDFKIVDPIISPHYVDVGSFIPRGFPISPADLNLRADNPLTEEGIALGRRLFYDPKLSGNNKQSCSSCHIQKYAFTNGPGFSLSIGADGVSKTHRNAPAAFNLLWAKTFTWDGAQPGLEEQLIGPITNPAEMNQDINLLANELQADPNYPYLFKKAFGSDSITIARIQKALAQFERTIVSGNSKWDKFARHEIGVSGLTTDEFQGMQLFGDQKKGDCTHCHSLGGTFTNFDFKHNGLDTAIIGTTVDVGRFKITNIGFDSMRFKTPTLRNIELTSPYMHDGRFTTLQEVIDFYDHGYHYNRNLDVNMALLPKNRLSVLEKTQIIAFLKMLTDSSLTTNPKYSDPF